MSMVTRTIRELGGEIDAEIMMLSRDPKHPFAQMDWRHIAPIVELVMGVLARHNGTVIVNDEDLPVPPLPRRSST
jgi:hypothetical protein